MEDCDWYEIVNKLKIQIWAEKEIKCSKLHFIKMLSSQLDSTNSSFRLGLEYVLLWMLLTFSPRVILLALFQTQWSEKNRARTMLAVFQSTLFIFFNGLLYLNPMVVSFGFEKLSGIISPQNSCFKQQSQFFCYREEVAFY